MIKKLLSVVAIAAFFGTASAQTNLVAEPAGPVTRQAVMEAPSSGNYVMNEFAKASSVNIADTLWYYFAKHLYRNAAGTGYYTFRSPNVYGITHFGCRFNNSNPNLAIAGLECVASKQTGSPSASLTVRMYLCNVTAGMPVFPPIDSITAVATSTAGTFIGGNFSTPKFVTGDFAVLYRGVPTVAGDTLRVWMNNANTASSTTTLTASKYGEGYAYMRMSGTFTTTTGIFGAGTDFEFLVAPRVVFTAAAAYSSSTVTPYCTGTPYTFNNLSSVPLGHRQYNMNQFYRTWKPFTNTLTIAADSVYTWNYGDATGNFYTTTGNPNPNHTYASAGVYNGTLTAKYQRMSFGRIKFTDAANFSKTVAVCSGIQSYSGVEAVILYPNPSVSGTINIANLPSESSIEIFNMLGQSVYKDRANAGTYSTDLSLLPKGSYFVKINALNEKTKILKLILN